MSMLLGQITYGSELPNSRSRDEQKSRLNMLWIDTETRRKCYLTAKDRMTREGFELGRRNRSADPSDWSHAWRLMVWEVYQEQQTEIAP